MNRPLIVLVFVIGLLFGTGLLMSVARAQAVDFGVDEVDQTEPSLRMQPERGLPKLGMA